MAKCTTFDSQLDHVLTSGVHAWLQLTVLGTQIQDYNRVYIYMYMPKIEKFEARNSTILSLMMLLQKFMFTWSHAATNMLKHLRVQMYQSLLF